VSARDNMLPPTDLEGVADYADQLPTPDLAEIIDGPWSMLLGSDLRFPDADGPRTPELQQAGEYMDAFRAAAADDPVLVTALLRALSLVDPPSRLRAADLRERAARALALSWPG